MPTEPTSTLYRGRRASHHLTISAREWVAESVLKVSEDMMQVSALVRARVHPASGNCLQSRYR
jgi:hypothetical protein